MLMKAFLSTEFVLSFFIVLLVAAMFAGAFVNLRFEGPKPDEALYFSYAMSCYGFSSALVGDFLCIGEECEVQKSECKKSDILD